MAKKHLAKSSSNKKIAGVCGGIGEYLDIDPTIVRLVWCISVVCCGFGFLAYVIAAFIMPKDTELAN
ncbi:MAG: PspC domain-containing protein [Synergistaceae bacterium]|nr:PspC domain-containing protein [Synergistaceae bacterium]